MIGTSAKVIKITSFYLTMKEMRIVIDDSTWERLNKEKRAGEDFNSVVIRLLDLKEGLIK